MLVRGGAHSVRGPGLAGLEGVSIKAMALADADEIAEDIEAHDAMWSRLLGNPRSDGRPERLVIINDEGHHCCERATTLPVFSRARA